MNKKKDYNFFSLQNPFDLQYIQEICQYTSPEILDRYFYKQKIPDNSADPSGLNRSNKDYYYKKILDLITGLESADQKQILTDFKIICFLARNQQQGKNQSMNIATISGFYHWLYIKKGKNISADASLSGFSSVYDLLFYLFIRNKKELSCFYCLYSHLETPQELWNIRTDYYNPAVELTDQFLQNRIQELEKQTRLISRYYPINTISSSITEFNNKAYLHMVCKGYLGICEIKIVLDKQKQSVSICCGMPDINKSLHGILAKIIFGTKAGPVTGNKLFNLRLILKRLLSNQLSKPLIKPYGNIQGFYINKLTITDTFNYDNEITFNTNHIEQIKSGDNTENGTLSNICISLKRHGINGVKDLVGYTVKSIEIIAVIRLSQLANSFKKRFMLTDQGQTDLGFDSLDEQIKDCLQEWGIINNKPANEPHFFFI